jgi:hypothetical protein
LAVAPDNADESKTEPPTDIVEEDRVVVIDGEALVVLPDVTVRVSQALVAPGLTASPEYTAAQL